MNEWKSRNFIFGENVSTECEKFSEIRGEIWSRGKCIVASEGMETPAVHDNLDNALKKNLVYSAELEIMSPSELKILHTALNQIFNH